MASRRQASLSTFWGTVERAATQGISFVVVAVLARYLGPENYGVVTLAATIALLGQTLIGETFSQALIQTKIVEPAHISAIFWLLLVASLVGVGLLVGLSDAIAGLFSQPLLSPILKALSPLLVLMALQAVPTALFKRNLDFRSLAVASTGGTLVGGFIGVGLAIAGFGPWSLVANLLVQNIVVTATIWRRARFRVEWRYSHKHLKELWSFGQYTFLLRIAAFTANQSPRILVGYLFGAASLGAFSLGLRIVEIMLQLLALPAASVTTPVIAKVRQDPDRLERTIQCATQLTAMISVPAFLGVALIAPFAVPLVFGAHWAQSIVIVQILALSGVFGATGLVYVGILTGLGRPDINLGITTSAAIGSVALLLLMAPWGIVTATTAFVIRGYLLAPLLVLLIARMTGIRAARLYRTYVPVVTAAIPMIVTVEGTIRWFGALLSPASLTFLAIAVGATSYGVGLSIFGRPALKLGASVLADLRPSQRSV